MYDTLFNIDEEELNMNNICYMLIVYPLSIDRFCDELSGGKTRPTFSELEKQSSCLAATNIVFVMDFVNSDRLDFGKPNPNDIALGG